MSCINHLDSLTCDRVLQYLSLFDLYNLAMTNARLRTKAVTEFKLRYWSQEICISDIKDSAVDSILFDNYLHGYDLVLNFLFRR